MKQKRFALPAIIPAIHMGQGAIWVALFLVAMAFAVITVHVLSIALIALDVSFEHCLLALFGIIAGWPLVVMAGAGTNGIAFFPALALHLYWPFKLRKYLMKRQEK